jgi:hypothetical protein
MAAHAPKLGMRLPGLTGDEADADRLRQGDGPGMLRATGSALDLNHRAALDLSHRAALDLSHPAAPERRQAQALDVN